VTVQYQQPAPTVPDAVWAAKHLRYQARQERAVAARRERRAQERAARLLTAVAGVPRPGISAEHREALERAAAARAERLARSVTPEGRRKCTWTPAEERFLACWWGVKPDAWVTRQLGRTLDSCELRAWKLGVRRTDNHFSFEQALAVFGISRNTLRKWIERGWVEAKRGPIRIYAQRRWSLSEASLRRLVTERAWLVEPAKMAPGHYLTVLATEAHAREEWLTTDQAAARVHVTQSTLTGWLSHGYGPFVQRPHHGGRGNVVRLVRAADLPALVERASQAASVNYRNGARRREAGKRERRAA
jgi:hypothetical protein